MTILQKGHHSFLIVEHDPLPYEDAERRMAYYIVQALKQTSWEATILLYAPALDSHLQKMTKPLADRAFCIYGEQASGRVKTWAKILGAQATLKAFSLGGLGDVRPGLSNLGGRSAPGPWSSRSPRRRTPRSSTLGLAMCRI